MQIIFQNLLRQLLLELKNHYPSLVPLGDLKIFPKTGEDLGDRACKLYTLLGKSEKMLIV